MLVFILVYLTIGAVIVLRDLSQPFLNRPLYLLQRERRLMVMVIIAKVLLWPVYLGLAHILFRAGRRKSSDAEVSASDEVVDLYNQGTINSSNGQYDKAIDLFTQALDREPRFAPAYINRGNAYNALIRTPVAVADSSFFKDKLDKAISDYSKAIEIDPLKGEVYYYRAVTRYVRGKYKESLLDIQQARNLGYKDIDPSIEHSVTRFVEGNL